MRCGGAELCSVQDCLDCMHMDLSTLLLIVARLRQTILLPKAVL